MDNKQMNEFLNIVDNIQLLPDEVIDNMDFYQLSSYIQSLNILESLCDIDVNEDCW